MENNGHLKFETVVVIGETVTGVRNGQCLLHEVAANVIIADDVATALRRVEQFAPELVLLSESIGLGEGLAFLRKIGATHPHVPVVVVAQRASVDSAVRFVRAGAHDYLGGGLDQKRLDRLIAGMSEEIAAKAERKHRFFNGHCPPGVPIVGISEAITNVLEVIRLIAESRCNPILIVGETGTGKELAAWAVHAWRCGDPEKFIAINCSSLTANLLESELFGHVKGAFTGADREKTGLFEVADSGTIFLDEISEMPPELQAKLLRVLQEKTFRKVGGTKDIPYDATVVASSNRNLLAETRTGRFRKDLYYRLAVFPITMPPLRRADRRDDILLLAEYFIETSTHRGSDLLGLSEAAREQLLRHNWPGNVRELRNVIERGVILEKTDRITLQSLVIECPEEAEGSAPPEPREPTGFSLETAEREFILRALKETGWQRTRAAVLLGITRATLHAKLKRYNIEVPGSRAGSPRTTDKPKAGQHL